MNAITPIPLMLWEKEFPELASIDEPELRRILKDARTMTFPANQRVSSLGSMCDNYILVIEGGLRVQILTESGREVVLYHVLPGDGCILTTSCLLSNEPFPAEGYTEADTVVLTLPAAKFEQAMQVSTLFRRFVFKKMGQRLTEVIVRMEKHCSQSIDPYLAEVLMRMNAAHSQPIAVTHQELASELGTAREVVSRHLKRFESQGWVRLRRGTIEIKSPEMLTGLAQR